MSDLGTMLLPFGFDSGATFSLDRQYRYRLWRSWGSREHRCVFVGLNPSTADEHDNDHTIRKCIGFARRWGFGAIDMVNLFAYAGEGSTKPTSLLSVADPVGPENDEFLERAFNDAHRIVWAWGRHNVRVGKLVAKRIASAGWLAVSKRCEVGTLGRNDDGTPRHPLTLAYSTRFEAQT